MHVTIYMVSAVQLLNNYPLKSGKRLYCNISTVQICFSNYIISCACGFVGCQHSQLMY